jgi:cbb3-type cytochrome oxidase subunit 3
VRGALAALALVAGLIVPASSVQAAAPAADPGSVGIRLVDSAAGSSGDPRARSYVVDRLRPGTGVRRRVEISNSTGSIANVAVYPAAASVREGNFAFAVGHTRNELTSWTSVRPSLLRLPPRSKASATVTIRVPRTASSGERHAVVWAEVSTPPPAAGGVRLVNRVGIRIYLSVGPGGSPRSDFAIEGLTARRGPGSRPLVVATVRNTGGSTLDIGGDLTLSRGPGGLRAGPFPVRLERELTPGRSQTLKVLLDPELPDGPWRAHLRLESGAIERAVTATIAFPSQAGSAPTDRGAGRLELALIALLIFLLTIASALLFWFFRRRRRGRRDRRHAAMGTDRDRRWLASR